MTKKASVHQAIKRAEKLLPGKPVPDVDIDPRWQAIIEVAAFIESEPEAVSEFAHRWGKHAQGDLQAAVATCILEHLLQAHFELIFPRARQTTRQSRRFAKTYLMTWVTWSSDKPNDRRRLKRLEAQLRDA